MEKLERLIQIINMNQLNLEQEFLLKIYENKIQKLTKIQAQKYLKKILKIMMIKDNIIKYYIKNSII